MGIRPGQCLALRLEEAIDDECAFFETGAASDSGRFAISHRAPGVDSGKGFTAWQKNAASVRDVPGIDRTMAGAQPGAGRTTMMAGIPIRPGAAAGPVNSDARELRILAAKRGGREQAKNNGD